MTVCFELKMSPLEAEKMYFDDMDYLGIIKYYDEIVKNIKELESKK